MLLLQGVRQPEKRSDGITNVHKAAKRNQGHLTLASLEFVILAFEAPLEPTRTKGKLIALLLLTVPQALAPTLDVTAMCTLPGAKGGPVRTYLDESSPLPFNLAQISVHMGLEALAQNTSSVSLFGRTQPPEVGWKGIFYSNPDDPALFVPKRFGIGYTLNFGNPWSWVVLALILAMVALPIGLSIANIRGMR